MNGLWQGDLGAVWFVVLDPVPGKVDAAVRTLLGLVHTARQVRTQVLALTRVATTVGTLREHHVTHTHVELHENKYVACYADSLPNASYTVDPLPYDYTSYTVDPLPYGLTIEHARGYARLARATHLQVPELAMPLAPTVLS